MNHCRRCDSDYEKPGTCNCFAPIRVTPQPPYVVPCITQPVIWPQPATVPYVDPSRPTITWGNGQGYVVTNEMRHNPSIPFTYTS